MKKVLMLATVYMALIFQINAENNTSEVFKVEEITWYGLDFSSVGLIGAIGFKDKEKIKDYYFDAWNSLIIDEPKKYRLDKFFRKESVEYYLDIATERNELPNINDLVIEDEYSFDDEKVMQIISEYDTKDNEGIGLAFIIESLDKYKEKAFIWVTFFDIKTKQVIRTEKFYGKAGGYGFRNYWAGAYHNVMKSASKSIKKENETINE
ncbi:MAG: hypothetical protein GY907_06390 [Bacteroidetes bacterium]|nr:hypothetical protein [Bacteroidota bacterium]